MASTDSQRVWLDGIRVSRMNIVLQPDRPWTLPPCPEVTVRGALGRALLEESCVRPDRSCVACDQVASCPIPSWFDPGRVGSQSPRPFALWVPGPSSRVTPTEPLVIESILLGEVPGPELLTRAVLRMAEDGLGSGRVPHRVIRAMVRGAENVPILELDTLTGRWPEPGTLAQLVRGPIAPGALDLVFQTPLRLDRSRRLPSATELLRSAILRVRSVARAQGVEVDRRWAGLEEVVGEWLEPQFVRQSRWSERQGTRVDLSGWVGTLRLPHFPGGLEDLIRAAEVLHLGRATSAGLGRFEVHVLEGAA